MARLFVLLMGAVCSIVATIGRGIAAEALFSNAYVSGYIDRRGCLGNSAGGYDCIGGTDTDHYEDEAARMTSAQAFATGFAPNPLIIGPLSSASARAQSESFSARAEAHAVGSAIRQDAGPNLDLIDGKATARATARWSAPIVFGGGVSGGVGPGLATMRFRVTGALSVSGLDEVAGALVTFGFLSLPGVEQDLATAGVAPLFSTGDSGTVDQFIDAKFAFTFGVPQQAVGILDVSATANAYHRVIEGGAGDGQGELIEGPFNGVAHADFFSTVQVDRLILPPGVSATDGVGAALPFLVVAVPEPRSYLLFAIGALLVAGAARRGQRAVR